MIVKETWSQETIDKLVRFSNDINNDLEELRKIKQILELDLKKKLEKENAKCD